MSFEDRVSLCKSAVAARLPCGVLHLQVKQLITQRLDEILIHPALGCRLNAKQQALTQQHIVIGIYGLYNKPHRKLLRLHNPRLPLFLN